MTTASLETSKKIFALVGEYETERIWMWSKKKAGRKCSGKHHPVDQHPPPYILAVNDSKTNPTLPYKDWIKIGKVFPASTFAELVRIVPKIGEKLVGEDKRNDVDLDAANVKTASLMLERYMNAPTEAEGMKAVEEFLLKVL